LEQFDYAFDDIGNRTATGGRASAVSTYTPNRLNQYSQRTVTSVVDVQGVANPTANVTLRVIGGTTHTAARKGEYYHHALNVGNNVYPQIEVKSLYAATQAQTNRVFNPSATETFTHDADGNLTQDGRWTYTWDGENRLIEMKRDTGTPAGARLRLVFEYDHQGRRIRKQFYTHNGSSWVLGSDIAFAYDGWNLVAELNAASSARIRTYHWGLDLSGTEQGAGGVGGLWLVTDHTSGTVYHWPAYDGNGNVAALVAQANGSLSARYEYGPFGETLRATGTLAKQNPFRFSTKYTDNETGLLYYGYRFYDPVTGRWPNRDPIGEQGGFNLYEFVGGDPISRTDRLGLWYPGYPGKPIEPWPPFAGPLPSPIPAPRFSERDKLPGGFTGIALCQRPLRETDCLNRFLNWCGQGHKFLAKFGDGTPTEGYGFYRRGVTPEVLLVCERGRPCRATDSPLRYGGGVSEGKTGETASLEDIMDCIKSRPSLGKYEQVFNDCRHWPAQAATDCGLDCGQ